MKGFTQIDTRVATLRRKRKMLQLEIGNLPSVEKNVEVHKALRRQLNNVELQIKELEWVLSDE